MRKRQEGLRMDWGRLIKMISGEASLNEEVR